MKKQTKISGIIQDQCYDTVEQKKKNKKVQVTASCIDDMNLTISAKGYECQTGCNEIALLEVWQGKLRLVVWADKEQEDPTHIIDLEGAKIKPDKIPNCPNCNGEREMDGCGGFACHFCGKCS